MVDERNMSLMINQINTNREIRHVSQKYSCIPKAESNLFCFDGLLPLNRGLISTCLPGCLLPPAPVDLEAQRGRPHEDARRQPHRSHDDHQRKFYWSNWHTPIDGQKYLLYITFS